MLIAYVYLDTLHELIELKAKQIINKIAVLLSNLRIELYILVKWRTGARLASTDTALRLVQLKVELLNSYIKLKVAISLFVNWLVIKVTTV